MRLVEGRAGGAHLGNRNRTGDTNVDPVGLGRGAEVRGLRRYGRFRGKGHPLRHRRASVYGPGTTPVAPRGKDRAAPAGEEPRPDGPGAGVGGGGAG